MNIRRGLLRTWVFLSVCWVAYWALRLWFEFRRFEDGPSLQDLQGAALVMLVPPLFLLAIGAGLYWSFSGFRRE